MALVFRSINIRPKLFGMNVTIRKRVRNHNTAEMVVFTRQKCTILICCPVVIMKMFVELILHFH